MGLELEVGLTDTGEIALEIPGVLVPIYLQPDDARLLARSLVAIGLEADRIRSAAN